MRLKKLKLNKEVLISLQEKQMQELMGGEAFISTGGDDYTKAGCTMMTHCISRDTCVLNMDIRNNAAAASCCRKTCNS